MQDVACDPDPLAQEQPPDPITPTFNADDGDRPSGVLYLAILTHTKGIYNKIYISQPY